jgi:hypothetical protein
MVQQELRTTINFAKKNDEYLSLDELETLCSEMKSMLRVLD